jgi:hypothetical protein
MMNQNVQKAEEDHSKTQVIQTDQVLTQTAALQEQEVNQAAVQADLAAVIQTVLAAAGIQIAAAKGINYYTDMPAKKTLQAYFFVRKCLLIF